MNNDQALAALKAKRDAINDAINGLLRYAQESVDWKAASASTKMAAVKTNATTGGVDLAAWDGTA